MSVHRGVRSFGAAVLAVSSLLMMPPSAHAYTPGTATAYEPYKDQFTGEWRYNCSFSHWRSGVNVTYHCKLYEYVYTRDQGWGFRLLDGHSGSWTPPPANKFTPVYSQAVGLGHGAICVRAQALSVDGGRDSGIGEKCK